MYGGHYKGEFLSRVAFPIGGVGSGMVCLEGSGALSHVSLRHKPEVFNEPMMFSALFVKGASTARVIEGPVPQWKAFGGGGNANGRKNGCGHWYARAMSSYALLQALSGARYDAVDQVLYFDPQVKGDFHAFLCTAGGYETVGVRNGEPFIEVISGNIPVKRIQTRQGNAHAGRIQQRTERKAGVVK